MRLLYSLHWEILCLLCLLVVDLIMKLPDLLWVMGCFPFIFMGLHHFLVLCGLYFFSTYGVSFGPLGVGYTAARVFDSGWIEYFGGQVIY